MKVGDKVKCVWVSNDKSKKITLGNIYNIDCIHDDVMRVTDNNGDSFSCFVRGSSFAKFDPVTEQQPDPIDKGEKYQREIALGVFVDIYDVLEAWGVSCPARQHAIKKLLAAGQRGHKSEIKDLQEAQHSAHRAIMFQIKRERKDNGQSLSDSIAD